LKILKIWQLAIKYLNFFYILGKKTNHILDESLDDEESNENDSNATLKPKGNI